MIKMKGSGLDDARSFKQSGPKPAMAMNMGRKNPVSRHEKRGFFCLS